EFSAVNFTGGGNYVLSSTITFSTVTVAAGSTFSTGGRKITVSSFTIAGNFTLQGKENVTVPVAPLLVAGSTVTYNATSGNATIISTWSFQNLWINGAATFAPASSLVINQNLVLSAGTFNLSASTYNITLSSSWINNGGSFNYNPNSSISSV